MWRTGAGDHLILVGGLGLSETSYKLHVNHLYQHFSVSIIHPATVFLTHIRSRLRPRHAAAFSGDDGEDRFSIPPAQPVRGQGRVRVYISRVRGQ